MKTVGLLLAVLAVGMIACTPARADSKSGLRLMTYNVNWANPDVKGTLDAIAAEDADVVLLQEITREWKHALVDRFAKQYPHQVFRMHTRPAGGIAVLSKHTITDEQGFASPQHSWFPAERLVLDGPFGKLQILNVHLRPAVMNGSWVKGYLVTPPLRLDEIETYWKQIKHDLPTIVAGDFNEQPEGTAVAFLEKQGLARAATTGPRTWHYIDDGHELLKMDIDHVMIDGTMIASDGKVLDVGASDHRPVVVTIAPKP